MPLYGILEIWDPKPAASLCHYVNLALTICEVYPSSSCEDWILEYFNTTTNPEEISSKIIEKQEAIKYQTIDE